MPPDEAKQILLKHSCTTDDTNRSVGRLGWLQSIREGAGLDEEGFNQILGAVSTLAPTFSLDMGPPDRDVMAALWKIVTLGRSWGLSTESTLTVRDARRLADWLDRLSLEITKSLDHVTESAVDPRDVTPDQTADSDTSTVDRCDLPPRCTHLWSTGLFMNAGLPPGQEVIGDGDFWCSLTQTVLGPDGRYCDGDKCRDSSRTCYEAP